MIVACTGNRADLGTIERSGERISVCWSLDDAIAAARDRNARLLVCDVTALRAAMPGELSGRIRSGGLRCPVVLRHDASAAAARELYHLARLQGDVRVSFREYDDLNLRLQAVAMAGDSTATLGILRCIEDRLPVSCREPIGILVMLCERRVTQTTAARAMGFSPSTLREWLARTRDEMPRLPRFPRLNATLLALHLLWKRERFAWNAKMTSRNAGFQDEKSCSNYLRYHLGKTERQLTNAGGYVRLLAIVTDWFTSRPPGVSRASGRERRRV